MKKALMFVFLLIISTFALIGCSASFLTKAEFEKYEFGGPNPNAVELPFDFNHAKKFTDAEIKEEADTTKLVGQLFGVKSENLIAVLTIKNYEENEKEEAKKILKKIAKHVKGFKSVKIYME